MKLLSKAAALGSAVLAVVTVYEKLEASQPVKRIVKKVKELKR